MMHSTMVDKLMDMCERHSGVIAEMWYKSLTTNPRTQACHKIPREVCLRQANEIYRSIADVYFAEDGYKAMSQIIDISGFVDTHVARGVPLEQTLYSLILLRRHIWIFADAQMIFDPSVADLALAIDSINRILVVFDYATHYICKTYLELAANTAQISL